MEWPVALAGLRVSGIALRRVDVKFSRAGRYMTVTFGLMAIAAVAYGAGDESEANKNSALVPCPVMGDPVNFAISTETDAGPVYFCCKDCIKKYEAKPEKYAQGTKAQRMALEGRPKVQVTCPVSHEAVDPSVSAEHDGKKVYFCCKKCVGKYEQDPQKYAAALANSYTYQTKCPVTQEPIDPTSFATLASGGKIYFCCDKCAGKLFGDPRAYLGNLKEQGYYYKVDQLKPADKDAAGGGGHAGH